jgi:sugar phosphate isomerase/epimerase
MYFAMDDLGDENAKSLSGACTESEKWHLVRQIASDFGFAGIQVSPVYRDRLGLSLTHIPDSIRNSFRLTYHPGGVYQLNTAEGEDAAHRMLSEGLDIGVAIGAEDVSFHPPLVADVDRLPLRKKDQSSSRCAEARARLRSLLDVWLPRFEARGITLSLETHFTPAVFVFDGISDFRDFCASLPSIGVLVDVSHNYHDGYLISEQLAALEPLRITGFNLSDTIKGKKLQEGTHLPVGQGYADFRSLSTVVRGGDTVYGALEVRGPARGISESLALLRALG